MKEALFYKELKDKIIQCQLCPRYCVIKENNIGKCKVRKNIQGKLYSLVYGKPCAAHIDMIEKKPIFHLFPGSLSYSIGTAGCNLFCKFCQNYEISQVGPEEIRSLDLSPEEVVKNAVLSKCKSIAYTYTEPATTAIEYVIDIAKLAKKKGIKNVIVSNGYINQKPLKELCKYIDAVNIDLKGNEEFYKEMCDAHLKPVLESLKTLKKEGVFVEITNLIIPGYNDDEKEIKKRCVWIKENLGENVPIHFSRFFPYYKLTNIKETPQETLVKAKEIAEKVGLKFIYIGNIFIEKAENTYCPKCKKLLVERVGFNILQNNIKEGKCDCGEKIPGIWD